MDLPTVGINTFHQIHPEVLPPFPALGGRWYVRPRGLQGGMTKGQVPLVTSRAAAGRWCFYAVSPHVPHCGSWTWSPFKPGSPREGHMQQSPPQEFS